MSFVVNSSLKFPIIMPSDLLNCTSPRKIYRGWLPSRMFFQRHCFPRGFSEALPYISRLFISTFFGVIVWKMLLPHDFVYKNAKWLEGGYHSPYRSQLLNKIGMTFQWLPHVFGVKLSNEINGNVVRCNRMWEIQLCASKPEIHKSQLVNELETQF